MVGSDHGVSGKVVVVTGAISGIGAATAQLLARDGASVIAAVRDDNPARRPDLGELADHVEYRRVDVSVEQDWDALASWLQANHGRVDGLVNNAGTAIRHRIEQVDHDGLHRMIAVNTEGPLLGMQKLAPLMSEGSSIVNIASVAATTAHYAAAYATSKWALRGLSKVAALEFAPRGIRVNTVLPGFIATPTTAHSSAQQVEAYVSSTPMGRMGRPEEVAAMVRFLLGDEASFVCGAEIPVDGGLTSHGGAKPVSDSMR